MNDTPTRKEKPDSPSGESERDSPSVEPTFDRPGQETRVSHESPDPAGVSEIKEAEIDLRDKIIEEYKKEKEELYDRLLRKQAEFENFRKRIEKEKEESSSFVQAEVIREFLPVVDACERALRTLPDVGDPDPHSMESFRSGVELIFKQFMDTLSKFDVAPIEAVGSPFDPNLHHAIMREETTEFPENHILEDLLTGYTFADRLLRPTQVKVAIPPSKRN